MDLRNKNSMNINFIVKAVVVDNRDPRNLRRLKVRIPYLHGSKEAEGSIEDENLPWAESALMEYKMVDTGTRVWVQFENGDIQLPVYVGIVNENRTISRKGGSTDSETYLNGESFEDISNYRENNQPYKSHYGTTRKGVEISSNDADEKECSNFIDRIGNYLRFISPINKSANAGNSSKRTNINYGNIFGKLKGGLYGVFLRMLSKSVFYMIDREGGSEIVLATGKGVGFSLTDKIIISNGKSSISLGDGEIILSSGSSSAVINSSGVRVDGSDIKMLGSSVGIESSSLIHNGSSAIFNSAVSLASPVGPEGSSPKGVETFSISNEDYKYY